MTEPSSLKSASDILRALARWAPIYWTDASSLPYEAGIHLRNGSQLRGAVKEISRDSQGDHVKLLSQPYGQPITSAFFLLDEVSAVEGVPDYVIEQSQKISAAGATADAPSRLELQRQLGKVLPDSVSLSLDETLDSAEQRAALNQASAYFQKVFKEIASDSLGKKAIQELKEFSIAHLEGYPAAAERKGDKIVLKRDWRRPIDDDFAKELQDALEKAL